MIHDIEGSAISAVRWFQNPQAQASSHYVVDGQTGLVYQLIKERDVAWHAGDRATNTRSVGIEHEGFAYRPGFFNPVEYEASARLTRAIALRYNIPRDRTHIIGHFEVPDSANPGHFGGRSGHTDPGPYWDWDYFMALTRNDARAVGSATLPVVLHPGETREAIFTLANTGDDPWLADAKAQPAPELRGQGPVYLGAYASGEAWGPKSAFYGAGWVSPRFAVSPTGGDTLPGAEGRFAVPLHAPQNVLGPVTETFRLFKTPIAPRLPVPFGPLMTVSARIVPWDITVSLPATPPLGWSVKTLPNGERAFWRKAAVVSPLSRFFMPGATMPPSVRWETNLPVAGEWDVYVRYTSGTGRNANATYRIPTSGAGNQQSEPGLHSVDQRASGGQWRKLGRFYFSPAPPPANAATTPGVRPGAAVPGPPPIIGVVELLPAAPTAGVLFGGAVRFVGPFPAQNKAAGK